jgi:hypothetical protein
VVFSPNDPDVAGIKALILAAFVKSSSAPVLTLEEATYQNAVVHPSQFHSYDINAWLNLPGTSQQVFVQAGPKPGKKLPYLRLDFNPAKLGESGMLAFKAELDVLLVGVGGHSTLFKAGKVTRLDIACDLLNVGLDELVLQSLKTGKTVAYYGTNGRVETIYKEVPPAKGYDFWRFKAYDKKQELLDTGASSNVNSAPLTRVEFVAAPKCAISKLKLMESPFAGRKVFWASGAQPPKGGDLLWSFFVDSCQLRGIKAAYARIPLKMRPAYRKAMASAEDAIWDEKTLWKAWPQVLKAAGLT